MRRTDDDTTTHFRSDRFFVVSGQWYFTTREGEDFGPYGCREDAEKKLRDYVETQAVMHRLRARDPTIKKRDGKKEIAELARDIQTKRARADDESNRKS